MPRSLAAALPSPLPIGTAPWLAAVRRRAKAWYTRHRRDLPWRDSPDPYRVWVSEIMLQQTQVATVIPYFERFVQQFPQVEALAAAPEDAVLRAWEGLGYYRRARQLHRAARHIVDEFAGQFPRSPAEIEQLPGIGRYTAGAIASIAFDVPAPIVEANTERLYARLLALRADPRLAASRARLWQLAEALQPRRGAGLLNQALMELGSQVCTPQQPDCPACPLHSLCPTHRDQLQDQIPARRPRPTCEARREAAIVVWRRGQVLVRRCGEAERWAGLWDFPRVTLAPGPARDWPAVAAAVWQLCGVRLAAGEPLARLHHGVTRFRITLECYSAQWRSGAPSPAARVRWLPPAELAELPLSTTGRRLARLIVAPVR